MMHACCVMFVSDCEKNILDSVSSTRGCVFRCNLCVYRYMRVFSIVGGRSNLG